MSTGIEFGAVRKAECIGLLLVAALALSGGACNAQDLLVEDARSITGTDSVFPKMSIPIREGRIATVDERLDRYYRGR
jgi:hypothetical protein